MADPRDKQQLGPARIRRRNVSWRVDGRTGRPVLSFGLPNDVSTATYSAQERALFREQSRFALSANSLLDFDQQLQFGLYMQGLGLADRSVLTSQPPFGWVVLASTRDAAFQGYLHDIGADSSNENAIRLALVELKG